MLEDRSYMRQPEFAPHRSAVVMLLIANVVAFIVECLLYGYPPSGGNFALSWDGIRHGYVWQLITFQFLHGGVMHLLFNCLAIFMFGRELEITLGFKRFLTLYFASGVVGGLFQILAAVIAIYLFPGSRWAWHFIGPTVGASAGAYGLVAAYAMLFPERTLVLLLFYVLPVTMRAKFLLLGSILLAVFSIILVVCGATTSNIADAAHLGGIVAGMVYVRYALNWNWHWPQFRRRSGSKPVRLVRVNTGSSWGREKTVSGQMEATSDEFFSREVDPILDKISAHGIQSLTERERRILQAARERMGGK